MRVGDAASINFRFALCGRAYAADDPTRLDEAASTQTVYANGTTYSERRDRRGRGRPASLDDSSLMVENTTAGNSFLRLGIGWLLEFGPDDVSINYSEGGVSFAQKGDALYLYFPNGIGSDTYADPGYFSLGVTLGEVIDEIRVPGTPGYYVPGGGGLGVPDPHGGVGRGHGRARSAPTGISWSRRSGRPAGRLTPTRR